MLCNQGAIFARHNYWDDSENQFLNIDKIKFFSDMGIICLMSPIGIALVIIGGYSACGLLSGIVSGCYTLGLGFSLLLLSIARGKKDSVGDSRHFEFAIGIVVNLGYVLIGYLTLANIASPIAAGYLILGIVILDFGLGCVGLNCFNGWQKNAKINKAAKRFVNIL